MLNMFKNKIDWRKAVKHHADRIRGMIRDTELFGEKFRMNDNDAVIVAAYLRGVHEGTENSKKVLEAMTKKERAI